MGTDKTVADCARVSFNKIKDSFDDKDESLIAFLAKHNHWSPFSHPQISLHVKAPIFVLRQLLKSVVGLTWNEVSRRYVDTPPEVYIPETWRGKAEDKKQGSSSAIVTTITGPTFGSDELQTFSIHDAYIEFLNASNGFYKCAVDAGVAPEMARMVLPLSTYSEGVWTGSLAAFARVYKLRSQPDAQMETREIASQINEIIQKLFPVSWRTLINA